MLHGLLRWDGLDLSLPLFQSLRWIWCLNRSSLQSCPQLLTLQTWEPLHHSFRLTKRDPDKPLSKRSASCFVRQRLQLDLNLSIVLQRHVEFVVLLLSPPWEAPASIQRHQRLYLSSMRLWWKRVTHCCLLRLLSPYRFATLWRRGLRYLDAPVVLRWDIVVWRPVTLRARWWRHSHHWVEAANVQHA